MKNVLYKVLSLSLFFLSSSLLIIYCKKAPLAANASIVNIDNKKIGTVELIQEKNGVRLKIDIKGLAPGNHAFYIHERGDFKTPDFKQAGGHFNPFNEEHGLKNPKGSHIVVKKDGTCSAEMLAENVTLRKGEKNSLLKKGGTSIIIHKMADDNKSNPSGKTGPRIAGGIIIKS